jgi:hypothetical protein
MAAQTFLRWAKLGGGLHRLVQAQRGLEFGMARQRRCHASTAR